MIKPLSQVISEPALPDLSAVEKALTWLKKTISLPMPFGALHLAFLAGILLSCVACLAVGKRVKRKHVNLVLFITASVLIFMETVKQLYYAYNPAKNTWQYAWGEFPFQFCSTPMYIMMLAALCRKGKLYDACTAFIATYGLFAGILVVILVPSSVLVPDLFLSVHTLTYHSVMIIIPAFLYGTNTVKPQFNTLQKALPIFLCLVGMAMFMNALYARYGNPNHQFNMFFISPKGNTPIGFVNNIIPKMSAFTIALCYTVIFTIAALLTLLFAMLVKLCLGKRLYEKANQQEQTQTEQEQKQELLTQNK